MKTITAIYENGVFKPKESVSLPSGAEVRVIVEDRAPIEILKERFPLSFGALSDDEAEELKRIIEEGCERIDPDEWK